MNEEVVRALSQPLWRKRLCRDEGISWEEDIGREDTETQKYKVYEFGKNSHCRTKKNPSFLEVSFGSQSASLSQSLAV